MTSAIPIIIQSLQQNKGEEPKNKNETHIHNICIDPHELMTIPQQLHARLPMSFNEEIKYKQNIEKKAKFQQMKTEYITNLMLSIN